MTTRRTETRRFRVDKIHDGCTAPVPGVWIHQISFSNAKDGVPQHQHYCSGCAEIQQLWEKWPKIEYGDTGDALTAAEALYGFCGWLTSREPETMMSSKADASAVCERIEEFSKANHLSRPRESWDTALKMPKEKK